MFFPTNEMMDVDKIIGQVLADQSAVGGDKSAPTVGPDYFVHLHNRAHVLDKSALYRARSIGPLRSIMDVDKIIGQAGRPLPPLGAINRAPTVGPCNLH